ncbi:hypothetical protein H6785_01710 [Candidatus Nomurabacteria bacterium]|nr:hypothetical protein [Candidatus Kaiserbacteria bacterium]MCB9815279.1 hypothetical protein [Candidatus Nomurabacteria bacterium]
MDLISLAEFRFKKNELAKELQLLNKRKKGRLLETWTRVSTASKSYHCCNCIQPIFEGEEYIRYVYVNFYGKWITRRHYPECFAPTPEEDEEYRGEVEVDLLGDHITSEAA